eukprot:g9570.t1
MLSATPRRRPTQEQPWPRGDFNDLHAAAMRGSVKWTLEVLSKGIIDINQGNPEGWTPLMCAASDGFASVVKVLLARGASVAVQGDFGLTALLLAASDGHLEVCKMLVEAGSDLEVATHTMGSTPLHLAGEGGRVDLMRVFIDAGADVNTSRPDGASVLFTAAEKGHVDAVGELLSAGANALLSRKERQGVTYVPLDVAAQDGHSEVVSELVRRLGIEGCGGKSGGVNALRLAARGQHLDIMRELTGAGVVDKGGEALINAAECGREGSILFLLREQQRQSGALTLRNSNNTAGAGKPYVESTDGFTGTTPLFTCIAFCASNAHKAVRVLVDAGADTASTVHMKHVPGATDTPLAVTRRYLRARVVNGKPATEEQMRKLEAIRRLLLRVPAARAVSWLWPSAIQVSVAGGAGVAGIVSSPLVVSTLPSLTRRARRHGVILTPLFRYSNKL